MISDRKYNFSPGPAQLPEEVLLSVQEQLLNWQSSGQSVMELSHRGKEFQEIAQASEANLRELMSISDEYAVMFLQGGASAQFAMIPMNFAHSPADYLIMGQWSKKAYKEAAKLGLANIVADGDENNYTEIPNQDTWQLSGDAPYLHLVSNETIGGLQIKNFPDVDAPIIVDMSSDILSRPIDINQFAMFYAGAQKNLGPAGVTLVVIKKDFLAKAKTDNTNFLTYQSHATADSCYNTPPCFSWYVLGEVLKWIKSKGKETVYAANQEKACLLYDFIDNSGFYSNPVKTEFRSDMNIPFVLADADLDQLFLSESEQAGLLNLKGHRSVGGMRASIYNAMPIGGVKTLIDFMSEFERKNG